MTARLLIVGPPGAGKGTQAALLSEALGIPTISTGDIFARTIVEGTELGKQVKAIVDARRLRAGRPHQRVGEEPAR